MSVPGGRLQQMSAIKLALLARQLRGNDAEAQALRSEPIAIVGMGCRFPGGGSDPASYWRMLEAGTDAIREVPADRWDWKRFFDADPAAPGKITTRWGGFLDAIDGFDAAFFGIAPREALHMDPQQRLFLEVVYEALEDAGLTRERLAGSRAGVFAASYHSDYAQMIYSARPMIGAHTVTGAAHSVLANRLSYLLDLRGPSVSIDTACSSSLVALHLACQSLRQGECDLAIAGGVSLMITPELSIALSKWGFLAEDGRCKTFDVRANGFVRGEGCGAVVLNRLGDALADGDTVLALVRGTAVNQDGRTNVMTAPSGLAQQAVVREALANAALSSARHLVHRSPRHRHGAGRPDRVGGTGRGRGRAPDRTPRHARFGQDQHRAPRGRRGHCRRHQGRVGNARKSTAAAPALYRTQPALRSCGEPVPPSISARTLERG